MKRGPLALMRCPLCHTKAGVPVARLTISIADGTLSYDCPGCGETIALESPRQVEDWLIDHGAELVVGLPA